MVIVIDNISKSFGSNKVLDGISLDLPGKGVVCFVGKSGSGKTTLFNIIANIIHQDSGNIRGLENKKIAYVFQEDRLVPYLSAKENVKLVLDFDEDEKEKISLFWLNKLLLGDFSNKRPCELSGGMRRRVSIARALAYEADILLLDEPFNGLDNNTKGLVLDIIKKESKKYLILLITHNYDEAELLSDLIYTIT